MLIMGRPSRIVGQHPFHRTVIRLDEALDILDRHLRHGQLAVRTLQLPMPVVVLCDAFLAGDDAWVMAAVASQVDPFVGPDSEQSVDMSMDMAWSVHQVEAAVTEEIDHVWQCGQRLPVVVGDLTCRGHVFTIRGGNRGQLVGLRGRQSPLFHSVQCVERRPVL